MKRSKKAMLAAGLLIGAAAMTGCASGTSGAASPTPATNEQATAEPASDQPGTDQSETDQSGTDADGAQSGEDAPLALRVDGKEAAAGALQERGRLLLPLKETGELLGWTASQESAQEQTQTRRSISLAREDSRITVAWVVSDNTIRQITWQRDGLLVPVDAYLTSAGDDVIYAPAAFFEEAMQVRVSCVEDGVEVSVPEPKQTPPTQADGDV